MDSMKVIGQLDLMIDDLLCQTDLPASSLASMLMAARDSVEDGYHVALARRVWDISNSMKGRYREPSAETATVSGAAGLE